MKNFFQSMTTRVFLILIAGVAMTAGLAACGEKKESVSSSGPKQSLTLMLDWFPNADHVGLYQALADGSFERAGLDQAAVRDLNYLLDLTGIIPALTAPEPLRSLADGGGTTPRG